jgi:hypothetical protein
MTFFFLPPYLKVISDTQIDSDFFLASPCSRFHFIHEAATIVMDITILYYKVLPWFWEVIQYKSFCSINLIMRFIIFLFVEIWNISNQGWPEC